MNQDTPSPSDYLFAQATDEARRLKRQSEFFHRFTSALLPLILNFGIATQEEVQVETLLQRLREEAATRQNVIMIHGLMDVRTRIV